MSIVVELQAFGHPRSGQQKQLVIFIIYIINIWCASNASSATNWVTNNFYVSETNESQTHFSNSIFECSLCVILYRLTNFINSFHSTFSCWNFYDSVTQFINVFFLIFFFQIFLLIVCQYSAYSMCHPIGPKTVTNQFIPVFNMIFGWHVTHIIMEKAAQIYVGHVKINSVITHVRKRVKLYAYQDGKAIIVQNVSKHLNIINTNILSSLKASRVILLWGEIQLIYLFLE